MKIGEQLEAIKKERNKVVIQMLKEGYTYQSIAEQVGTSMSLVERTAKANGLQSRKRTSANGICQCGLDCRPDCGLEYLTDSEAEALKNDEVL
jgi:hypothetical protein